jgi:hypothetical protein
MSIVPLDGPEMRFERHGALSRLLGAAGRRPLRVLAGPPKHTKRLPHELSACLVVGLLSAGYVEEAPLGPRRVFRKHYSAVEYLFLDAEGRLGFGDARTTLRPSPVAEATVNLYMARGSVLREAGKAPLRPRPNAS